MSDEEKLEALGSCLDAFDNIRELRDLEAALLADPDLMRAVISSSIDDAVMALSERIDRNLELLVP